jgi:hypothetical protein
MGKAADNEKIKLRAVFYNNIAVGLCIAGAIAPIFSVIEAESPSELFSLVPSLKELLALVLAFVGFLIAFTLRQFADSLLEKLMD